MDNEVVHQGERCPFMGYYYSCYKDEDDDLIYPCPYLEGDENRMHECPANISKTMRKEMDSPTKVQGLR